MDNRPTQLSRVLAGAVVGAGFAFLFLTLSGKRFLDSAEPRLDGMIRDMQRLRGAAVKAQDAFEEGRRSFETVKRLRQVLPSEEEFRHQERELAMYDPHYEEGSNRGGTG